MRLTIAALYIAIGFFHGCKDRSSDSALKHELGKTSRDDSLVAVCKQSTLQSRYPKADGYLRKLLEALATKNETAFKGKFSSENICITLVGSGMTNAEAVRQMNTIRFHSGLLVSAPNDAAVAAILAHEAAHLLMQSVHVADRVPDAVINNPNWLQVRNDFERAYSSHKADIMALKESISQNANSLRAIEKSWRESAPKELLEEMGHLPRLQGQTEAIMGGSLKSKKEMVFKDLEAKLKQITLPYITDIYGLTKASQGELAPAIESRPKRAARVPEVSDQLAAENVDRYIARCKKAIRELKAISKPNQYETWLELESSLKSQSFKANELEFTFGAARQKFNTYVKSVVGEEQSFNWQEQEADEVGYELYLRAGFRSEDFNWLNRTQMTLAEAAECEDNYISKRLPPVRGFLRHPGHCWRIYDIQVLEADYHKVEYDPLKKVAILVELFPGALEEAKSEIKSSALPEKER
ncbi:MAG: hypothetical protein NTV34_03065 [Proteobacteria bacterium]|nr:hypothetical protein [Pseudomonadota bacterium]